MRFLRLLTLWLIALALPVQGALAATGMAMQSAAPPHTMTMDAGRTMADGAMPCHDYAIEKSGCGACCGPIVSQRQPMLAVAPVAIRWAALPRHAADDAAPLFLTGGTERPPRRVLA
jgi:hypothetical protein